MFFAPVVRTRADSPSFRSFDRSFERFVNDAFFTNAAARLQCGTGRQGLDRDAGPARRRPGRPVHQHRRQHRAHRDPAEAKRQFKAAYELPQDIDADASAAKLENGVLTLTLAKQVPVSNARQIEIK